jgi:hypothetical protein
VLEAQVSQLERPTDRVYKALRNWFGGSIRGLKSKTALSGQARFVYDNKEDLAALKPPADKDMLSRFIQDHWPLSIVSQTLDLG